VSWCAILCGAALWITGALIVAFPVHATSLEVDVVIKSFIENERHPITLSTLLSLDILISLLILRDKRVHRAFTETKRMCVTVLACFLFLGIGFFLPTMNSALVLAHVLMFGWGAIGCLLIIRAISYAPPQVARAI
jgi:hypothetical protein